MTPFVAFMMLGNMSPANSGINGYGMQQALQNGEAGTPFSVLLQQPVQNQPEVVSHPAFDGQNRRPVAISFESAFKSFKPAQINPEQLESLIEQGLIVPENLQIIPLNFDNELSGFSLQSPLYGDVSTAMTAGDNSIILQLADFGQTITVNKDALPGNAVTKGYALLFSSLTEIHNQDSDFAEVFKSFFASVEEDVTTEAQAFTPKPQTDMALVQAESFRDMPLAAQAQRWSKTLKNGKPLNTGDIQITSSEKVPGSVVQGQQQQMIQMQTPNTAAAGQQVSVQTAQPGVQPLNDQFFGGFDFSDFFFDEAAEDSRFLLAQNQVLTQAQNVPAQSLTGLHKAGQVHPATQSLITFMEKTTFKDGSQKLSVTLNPPELGRVMANLEMGADKRMRVALSVEKPAALHILQRDSSVLEQALEKAGLDLGEAGLEFSLEQNSLSFDQGQQNAEILAKRQKLRADFADNVFDTSGEALEKRGHYLDENSGILRYTDLI